MESDDIRAYVFRGDSASAERLWVCLRSGEASDRQAWICCWSSDTRHSNGEVAAFLARLADDVRRSIRQGPFGAYLDGHHFYDGWDTWGGGTPAPLVNQTPQQIATNATEYRMTTP